MLANRKKCAHLLRRALGMTLLFSVALSVSAPTLQAATDVPACGFAEVLGVVTASDTGLPLAEIEVSAEASGDDIEEDTDATGSYTTTLPVYRDPGPYRFTFTPPDGSPYLSVGPDSTQVISGGTTTLNKELPLGGVIQGRVTAADTGEPMEGVRIETSGVVRLEDFDPQVASTETDEDGRYRLQGLIAGVYVVKYDPRDSFPPIAENAPYEEGYVGGGNYPEEGTRYEIAPPQVITVDIEIPLGGIMSGVVQRSDVDTPATDVSVSIYLYDEEEEGRGDFVQGVTTNDDGIYEFKGLAPGNYLLRASPLIAGFGPQSPHIDLKPEWYPDAALSADAEIIEIPAISIAQAISLDITLEPGAVITGIVTDADSGAPIEGIGIDFRPPIGRQEVSRSLFQYRTDASGQFSVTGLYSGTYGLLWDNVFGPYGSVGRNSFTGITVTVSTGVITNANFTLQRGGDIQGSLTGDGGGALANIQVSLISVDTGRVVRTVTSNDAGNYGFSNITPGDYNVKYDRFEPCGCYNNEFLSGDESEERAVVTVEAQQTTDGVDAGLGCNAPPVVLLEMYLPHLERVE